MAFQPFKIDHSAAAKELDPVKIFNSLTLRGSVNDLWPPQVDALAKWNAVRHQADVSIEMNTGGGKTLVGLLIALSMARELGKLVLFACPTKQLIQQTLARANECSIDAATYYESNWTDETIATSAAGPCITTHKALFTGLSTFKRYDIGAVILDDAHAAGGVVRDCFTLRILRSDALYEEVAELFRPYFASAGYDLALSEVLAGASRDLLFVPLFVSSKLGSILQKKCLAGGIAENTATKFAWAHIKDALDRCVILLSSDRIEMSPACPPTEVTPFFGKEVRRVYLSATLPSPLEFYRTFGTLPNAIRPVGRSGEAQRVFLSAYGNTDDEQREDAKVLLKARKALVLTTSNPISGLWTDCADKFERADGHERIEAFAKAPPPTKLVIANRYDGLDLPGDACRILVIDGLPRGEALLSRYLNESLRIEAVRAASTAIRITQAVGRIFRSNTDHGAVVLIGKTLQRWLTSPANRAFLPPLLQQQLDLASQVATRIEAGDFGAVDVLEDLLKGTRNWDSFYKENIGQFATRPAQTPPTWLTDAIKTERSAHHAMWSGDFASAASLYADAAGHSKDPDLAAWNRHFEGYCLERANRAELAAQAFNEAANQRGSLGRPRLAMLEKILPVSGLASQQAQAVAKLGGASRTKAMATANNVVAKLTFGPETSSVEQAICELGVLLGTNASRPDKEKRIGPDVLWLDRDGETGWGLEAKTDKKAESSYTKDDIGQVLNHREWLRKSFPNKAIGLSLVGRIHPVTSSASPDDDLTLIDLAAMKELARRVVRLYEGLALQAVDANVAAAWLRHLGLEWPQAIRAMPMVKAIDSQAAHE